MYDVSIKKPCYFKAKGHMSYNDVGHAISRACVPGKQRKETISPEARNINSRHRQKSKFHLLLLQLKNSFSLLVATSKCHTGNDICTQSVESFVDIDLKLTAAFTFGLPFVQHR